MCVSEWGCRRDGLVVVGLSHSWISEDGGHRSTLSLVSLETPLPRRLSSASLGWAPRLCGRRWTLGTPWLGLRWSSCCWFGFGFELRHHWFCGGCGFWFDFLVIMIWFLAYGESGFSLDDEGKCKESRGVEWVFLVSMAMAVWWDLFGCLGLFWSCLNFTPRQNWSHWPGHPSVRRKDPIKLQQFQHRLQTISSAYWSTKGESVKTQSSTKLSKVLKPLHSSMVTKL